MRQALINRRPGTEGEAHRAAAAAPADIVTRPQKTSSECWCALCPLPFYAGIRVKIASRRVKVIRGNARLTLALIHGMLKNAVYTVVPEAIKSWPLREKRAVRGDALPT